MATVAPGGMSSSAMSAAMSSSMYVHPGWRRAWRRKACCSTVSSTGEWPVASTTLSTRSSEPPPVHARDRTRRRHRRRPVASPRTGRTSTPGGALAQSRPNTSRRYCPYTLRGGFATGSTGDAGQETPAVQASSEKRSLSAR